MGEGPAISYRLFTEADLSATTYVRKAALEALVRENGREPEPWMPRAPIMHRHLLETDPEGAWAAEIEGVLVGYGLPTTGHLPPSWRLRESGCPA